MISFLSRAKNTVFILTSRDRKVYCFSTFNSFYHPISPLHKLYICIYILPLPFKLFQGLFLYFRTISWAGSIPFPVTQASHLLTIELLTVSQAGFELLGLSNSPSSVSPVAGMAGVLALISESKKRVPSLELHWLLVYTPVRLRAMCPHDPDSLPTGVPSEAHV